ncbi:pirin family protein [Aliamphritea hakodatensis]|uniref:pirin family protein n=1 Tax=Aliamphritea hakodatensis TaxID=2895352 RepID=UPI0022FD9041|nr:pirin family protein [Aliamphritea hakodatensis]
MHIQIINSRPSSDGAGVKLQRIHGFRDNSLDPFLMLDEINSDNPDDYIAGFPPHPHRGLETLTYIRAGGFEHKDHMGNEGGISQGEAQWMSAGKGVIHSEKPLMEQGHLHGFQLWINLPAANKMQPAAWKDIPRSELPWQPVPAENGTAPASIKVISGSVKLNSQTFSGPLQTTAPTRVADLQISAGQSLTLNAARDENLLIFVYEGQADIAGQPVNSRQMARISDADDLQLSTHAGTGMLVLSGKPLNEPVAHHGPFVMNTAEEIQQAIADYQAGTLTN